MGSDFEWSRRGFLQAGGLGAAAAVAGSARALGSIRGGRDDRAVVFLTLVGGPSQLDSFDPKPDAPAEVRGPFRSIATTVPGVRLAEHLPLLARRLDRVALVRGMHHDAPPSHEAGLRLIQTGADSDGLHFAAAAASQLRSSASAPPCAVLPGPIGPLGLPQSPGQSREELGVDLATLREPASSPPTSAERAAYGESTFGRSCLRARRLVEAGTPVVVVNMYTSVHDGPSWDCHGDRGFATLADYARTVLPDFDRGFHALLDDLESRGRLGSTLVVATGEFGRSPRLNHAGGRDHWPAAWTALLAGGGVRGGQTIGATDRLGGEPADRRVHPAELVATVFAHLGLCADGRLDALPIREAFA